MLDIVPIPALRDNYIWALHNRQHAVVVDPGEASPVLSWLEAQRLKLAAILCTHHHLDHIGGIAGIGEVYNVPVYAPLAENIPGATRQLAEDDTVNLPELDISLAVIDIRGHTRGHIAYLLSFPKYMVGLSPAPSLSPSPVGRGKLSPSPAGGRVGKGERISPIMETSIIPGNIGSAGGVFCGDTLFGCGCGRLFEGTAEQLHGALQRLAALPDDTLVYCAHEYTEANIRFALACEPGNARLQQRAAEVRALRAAGNPSLPSTIGLEKATNPFLRCNEAEIIRAARKSSGIAETGELAVFTALRNWKDHFTS